MVTLNSLLFETHKPIEHAQHFIFILSTLQNVSLSFFCCFAFVIELSLSTVQCS